MLQPVVLFTCYSPLCCSHVTAFCAVHMLRPVVLFTCYSPLCCSHVTACCAVHMLQPVVLFTCYSLLCCSHVFQPSYPSFAIQYFYINIVLYDITFLVKCDSRMYGDELCFGTCTISSFHVYSVNNDLFNIRDETR
jgi:hypothetical protein